MPIVEVELFLARRSNSEEQGTVELNIPQKVLDADGVLDWIDEQYRKGDEAFVKRIDGAMAAEIDDEDVEFTDVTVLD